MPGGLFSASAGTLQLGLSPLGSSLQLGVRVLRRRELRLERRSQLGLLPPGILVKLGQLPVHTVAVRPGRLGSLLYPGCALLGGLGARLSVVGPGPRSTDSLVPLLLCGGHPLLSGPLRLSHLYLRGHGCLLRGSPPSKRLRQLRVGLQGSGVRLLGLSLGLLTALPARTPPRNPRAVQFLRLGHSAALQGQLLAPPERRQCSMRLSAHRVQQAAVLRPRSRPGLARPGLILTAGICARAGFLSGIGHRDSVADVRRQLLRQMTSAAPPVSGGHTARRGLRPRLPIILAGTGNSPGSRPSSCWIAPGQMVVVSDVGGT